MSQIHDISQVQTPEYWKNRAYQAEDKCDVLATELYTIEEIMGNPNFTDKEKVFGVTYFQWYNATEEARADGSRYYNAQAIATRQGSPRTVPERPSPKEQAISPVHTKFKKAGLISTRVEPQKRNKSRENQYDLLSPQFMLNARNVTLEEKSGTHGGHRVPKHRGCGGDLVADPATFHCLKCFKTHIPADKHNVLMVDMSPRCETCGGSVLEYENGNLCQNVDCEQYGVVQLDTDVEETPGPVMDESIKQEDFAAPDNTGLHVHCSACPQCGSFSDWVPTATSWGGQIYVCAICTPDVMSA